ncbi:MAG: ABC transporter permease subunit, partial [Pseudomonadota bacterium]
ARAGAPMLTPAGVQDLWGGSWRPVEGLFGLGPLVLASLGLAVVATALSVLLGLPAAVRLALLAGVREARIGSGTLTLLAGLPSVIVGLAGLFLLVPVTGFSALSAILTLTLMTWPVYTLLLYTTLTQVVAEKVAAAEALGIPPRTAAYRIGLAEIRAAHVRILALVLGKAVGEATAVSLVGGNLAQTGWALDPLAAVHTLTTMVLKDHGAAAGDHLAAVYVAALCLGGAILTINLVGAVLARRLGE